MNNSNGLSLQFQCITLSISTIIIALLVLGQLQKFCSADKVPRIIPVTPKTLHTFVATPAKVTVGMTVTDFPEFNVSQNTFQITGIIWFRFDPALIGLSTIEKFTFDKGKVDLKSEPITSLDGDLLTARYSFSATFRTNLYYGFFPFEDHTINLMLINREVTPDECAFKSSYADFIVDDPSISGWDYTDHHVVSGYSTLPLGARNKSTELAFPAVLFALDFLHNSTRYIVTILLPLLIIFFIDLFSLCFDQRKDRATLVGLTTTNITALVAYRFVLETMTPKVGYPTIADYLFFLYLTNTFVTFVINCVGPYLTQHQKKIVSLTLQTTVVSVIFYLLTYWIPC